MRQRVLFILIGIALLIGLSVQLSTLIAFAASPSKQINFYTSPESKFDGKSGISWLYVKGTNQNGVSTTWSKSFSSPVNNYGLSNWWWKDGTQADVQFRMIDGHFGSCTFDIPVQRGYWIQVGVDRGGVSCWMS